MSGNEGGGVIERRTISGNKSNWRRAVTVEAYEGGCVRLQAAGNPVDVILLTRRQVREILRMSEGVPA